MGYNTFPTLQGTGWDIKKRQLWSTDVEVSASGTEFRTGYWANPIYEFDMSINYMSKTDKATLEAFYVQQQGPLIPFLLAPTNEATPVSAQVFFTGNGTTKTAALPTWPATVTAMHQTDWQGRLALSGQPRTNYFEDVSKWAPITGTTITASSAFPGAVTVAGGSTSAVYGTQGNTYTAPGTQVTLYVSTVFAKAAGSFGYLQLNYTPSGQVTGGNWIYIDLGTGALGTWQGALTWQNILVEAVPNGFRLSLAVTLAAASQLYALVGPANAITNNQDNRATSNASIVVGAIDLASAAGVHISTTTAPVTVTDYAVDTSGNVTWGQAPASGATVDWDGQAAYIVRFVDDQTSGGRSTGGTSSPLEINQFMSGMYEQAGITFRTVR